MLNTSTAAKMGLKIWQKPHTDGDRMTSAAQLGEDGSWTLYSLSKQKGFEETDQARGWEMYLFDFKSERAAFIEGMGRLRPMGLVQHIKDTLVVDGATKQALFIAFEEEVDYLDLIDDIGGTEGDLIVHTYTESK